MMNKMLVLVKATDGRVAELAKWYDETHMPDLLSVAGIVSVERHSMIPLKRPEGTADWDFMMLYTMDAEDPMTVLAAMAQAQAQGKIPLLCDALDSDQTVSLIAKSETLLVE